MHRTQTRRRVHLYRECSKPPGPDALLAEIEATHHQESALMARRLAAIAALPAHRIGEAEEADPDRGYHLIPGFARTTAEVSGGR